MDVTVCPADRLATRHWDAWTELLDQTSRLHSPFLRPGFVRAAAAVRPDISVAVWEGPRGVRRLLAFQREGPAARPVAAGLNEWQAVVAPDDERWEWPRLLAELGLRSFRFDHLRGDQARSRTCAAQFGASPYVDLSRGVAEYFRGQRASGRTLETTLRKARKLERDVGPLRFELRAADSDEAFAALLRWKGEQHRRTGVPDVFQLPWVVGLLEQVRRADSPDFAGWLSALYAGERLVAVHLGPRSHGTLHYWYPAYDHSLGAYSPGQILLLRLLEGLEVTGVTRLDFGPGGQPYKESWKTADDEVALGVAGRGYLGAAVRRHVGQVRRLLRASPWAALLRAPWRAWVGARRGPVAS